MIDSTLDLEAIRQAQRRIASRVQRTPLLHCTSIGQMADAEVRLKAEHLQRTGSFKIRGAFNKLLTLDEARRPEGVVTASSGNHAQAVAFAARALGLSATVVLPTTANPAKVQAARDFGATIEFCGTTSAERLARAAELADAEHPFVPPYDDYTVMAGQGTIGLEILGDFPAVDTILVPVGGGGLISGIACAVKNTAPHVRIIGVEPDGAPKATTSRQAGRRSRLDSSQSIADGLLALAPGELTWPLIERWVDDLVTVSDQQIMAAMRLIWERAKQLVEPSGAAALAFALSPSLPFRGQNVVAILSGGNVDWRILSTVIG